MAFEPSPNLLSGIANPQIANIPAAVARGRATGIGINDRQKQEEIRRLQGEILAAGLPKGLKALALAAPKRAIETANALGFNKDPAVKMENFIKTVVAAKGAGDIEGPAAALEVIEDAKARMIGTAAALGEEPETGAFDGLIEGFANNPQDGLEGVNLMTDVFIENGDLADPAGVTRKETRGDLRKQVTSIRKQVGVLESNFGKIDSLIGEAVGGNRTAVAQVLVALVKLGDPTSVVKLEEMRGALNNPSPTAAITALLKDPDSNVNPSVQQAFLASLDPLNPGNIIEKDIRATANALVSSSAPAIQAEFAEASELGGTLSKRGRSSIFTKSLTDRVAGLSSLVGPAQTGAGLGEPTAAQIAELRAARPDLTEQQIKDALK